MIIVDYSGTAGMVIVAVIIVIMMNILLRHSMFAQHQDTVFLNPPTHPGGGSGSRRDLRACALYMCYQGWRGAELECRLDSALGFVRGAPDVIRRVQHRCFSR